MRSHPPDLHQQPHGHELLLPYLIQRVVALVEEPWDADLMAPGDDPAERQATFGESYGLLSFHVDDAAELIRIFDIAWIG